MRLATTWCMGSARPCEAKDAPLPADRVRARAMRVRAARYPWFAGATARPAGPAGEAAAPSWTTGTLADEGNPVAGLPSSEPVAEIATSESI